MKVFKAIVLLIFVVNGTASGQRSPIQPVSSQGQKVVYYCQAGVFADERNAFSLASYIESLDNSHPVKIVPKETNQGLRYYVIIDNFYSLEEIRPFILKTKIKVIIKQRVESRE